MQSLRNLTRGAKTQHSCTHANCAREREKRRQESSLQILHRREKERAIMHFSVFSYARLEVEKNGARDIMVVVSLQCTSAGGELIGF